MNFIIGLQQACYTLSDWLQILVEGDSQIKSSIDLLSLLWSGLPGHPKKKVAEWPGARTQLRHLKTG